MSSTKLEDDTKSQKLVTKKKSENSLKNLQKQLYMLHDFLEYITIRTNELVDFSKVRNDGFDFANIPYFVDEAPLHSYQNTLLNIDVMFQYVAHRHGNIKRLANENGELKVILKEIKRRNSKIRSKCKELEKINVALEEGKINLKAKYDLTKDYLEETRKELRLKNKMLNVLKKGTDKVDLLNEAKYKMMKERDALAEENILLNEEKKKINEENVVLKSHSLKLENELENLILNIKTTTHKKSKKIKLIKDENLLLKDKIRILEYKSCHCKTSIDIDGIMEENRRLWEVYNRLELEYVNCEYEKQKYKRNLEQCRLSNIKNLEEVYENANINIFNAGHQKIVDSKERVNKIPFQQSHREDTPTESKITHLLSYLEELQEEIHKNKINFEHMEENLYRAQHLLTDYKQSHEKMEELLHYKNAEHKSALSQISKALDYQTEETHLLKCLLSEPSISSLIDVQIKIEDFEITLCNVLETEDKKSTLKDFHRDLKEKVVSLRENCKEEISKIVDTVEEILEEYKCMLFENGTKSNRLPTIDDVNGY